MTAARGLPREAREVLLGLVVRFLRSKGEMAAAELRRRVRLGLGIAIKDLHFAPQLLEEALRRWGASEPAARAPAPRPRRLILRRSSGPAASAPAPAPGERREAEAPSPQALKRSAPEAAEAPACCRRRCSIADEQRSAAAEHQSRAAALAAPPTSGPGLREPAVPPAATAQEGSGQAGVSPPAPCEPPASAPDHGASLIERLRSRSAGSVGGPPPDAVAEARRILALRREAFASEASWAAAVLRLEAPQAASVQRAFRGLARLLHPDKAGDGPLAARAFCRVREARGVCDRSLLRLQAPAVPRMPRVETLCSDLGRRRFRVSWAPPREQPSAPATRYSIAVLDPLFGQALPVATLEPESKDLGRLVAAWELTSWVLEEESLEKLPGFWQQQHATVLVAAANAAGQSAWAPLRFSLSSARVGQKAAAAPRRRAGGDVTARKAKHRRTQGVM